MKTIEELARAVVEGVERESSPEGYVLVDAVAFYELEKRITTSPSRREVADEWYSHSDLNGFQIKDANGWEDKSPDELERVIFVEPDGGGGDSVRRVLNVKFVPGKDIIEMATIDGEEII